MRHQFAIIANFVVLGSEMAVPEERDLLFERAPGDQHALGKPGRDTADFPVVREAQVVALIDDGLQPHDAGLLLDFDAERLAGLQSLLNAETAVVGRNKNPATGRCRFP